MKKVIENDFNLQTVVDVKVVAELVKGLISRGMYTPDNWSVFLRECLLMLHRHFVDKLDEQAHFSSKKEALDYLGTLRLSLKQLHDSRGEGLMKSIELEGLSLTPSGLPEVNPERVAEIAKYLETVDVGDGQAPEQAQASERPHVDGVADADGANSTPVPI